MNAKKIITSKDVCDELFSGSKYPSYGGDLSKVIFGVETEFIVHAKDSEAKLMDRGICRSIFRALKKKYGYKNFHQQNEDSISLDTELGFICIKPDFSYNILEVAFPPRGTIKELKDMLQRTFDQIDDCLEVEGFVRAKFAVVPTTPARYDLVEQARHAKWLELFKNREATESAFYSPDYPALMAATQVHLNVLDKNFFKLLPFLYELEWLVVSTYSKSTKFNNQNVKCARVRLIEDTLGHKYSLKGIPENIPNSAEKYATEFQKVIEYVSGQPEIVAKDYSFIRPRSFGSVEFRSTCAQHDVETIIEICAFRILQFAYALERVEGTPSLLSRTVLLAEADGVPTEDEVMLSFRTETYRAALAVLKKLPSDWGDVLKKSKAFGR